MSNPELINLGRETQEALELINISISQVLSVEFYNPLERRMQQCTYDEYDQIAKDVWYKRNPQGENCRVIHPDLKIQVENGYLERATEEDGSDGWVSVGESFSLVDYVPEVGTLLVSFIK